MATASNLLLLAARSPRSCWMLWSFLPPSATLAGTTSGGPLLWFGWDACCWGCCWRELALGLFLSTVKEHVLSVVTTLIIIIPPSITAAVVWQQYHPPYTWQTKNRDMKSKAIFFPCFLFFVFLKAVEDGVWDFNVKMIVATGWDLAHRQIESQDQIWEIFIEFRGLIMLVGRD